MIGVLTLGGSQKFDTDHNDASVVYSYVLGGLLGAEIGVVGFGDNAFTHAGSGGVRRSFEFFWGIFLTCFSALVLPPRAV